MKQLRFGLGVYFGLLVFIYAFFAVTYADAGWMRNFWEWSPSDRGFFVAYAVLIVPGWLTWLVIMTWGPK